LEIFLNHSLQVIDQQAYFVHVKQSDYQIVMLSC